MNLCFVRFTDAIPTHWSVIVGEDSLMINGSLKRSLEISNIYLHPNYKSNAPSFEFPSDYDVGKAKNFFVILCIKTQYTEDRTVD